MSKSKEKLLRNKGLLAQLEAYRNEKKAIKVLKRENLLVGAANYYIELEELKESHKKSKIKEDRTLSLSELDKVAGGVKGKAVKRRIGEESFNKRALLLESLLPGGHALTKSEETELKDDIEKDLAKTEEKLMLIEGNVLEEPEHAEKATNSGSSMADMVNPATEVTHENIKGDKKEENSEEGHVSAQEESEELAEEGTCEKKVQAPVEKMNIDAYIRPKPQIPATQNAIEYEDDTTAFVVVPDLAEKSAGGIFSSKLVQRESVINSFLDGVNFSVIQTDRVEQPIENEIERTSCSCRFEEFEDEYFEDEYFSYTEESLVARGTEIDETTKNEDVENEIDQCMERFIDDILTYESRSHNFSMEMYDEKKEAIIRFFKENPWEFKYWESCCKEDPSNVNELILIVLGDQFLIEDVDVYDIVPGEDFCEETNIETQATVDEVYIILSRYYNYEPEDVIYTIDEKRGSLLGWDYQSFEKNLEHIFKSAILSCDSHQNMETLKQISKVFFEEQLENIFTSALAFCNSSKEIGNLKQFSEIFSEYQLEDMFKSALVSCDTIEKLHILKQCSETLPEYHPLKRGISALKEFHEFCKVTTEASEENLKIFWQMKSKLKVIGLHESELFKKAASDFSERTVPDYIQLALNEKISIFPIYLHILPFLSPFSIYIKNIDLIYRCKRYLEYIQKIIDSSIKGKEFFEVLSKYQTLPEAQTLLKYRTLSFALSVKFPREWITTGFVTTFHNSMDEFKEKIEQNIKIVENIIKNSEEERYLNDARKKYEILANLNTEKNSVI